MKFCGMTPNLKKVSLGHYFSIKSQNTPLESVDLQIKYSAEDTQEDPD